MYYFGAYIMLSCVQYAHVVGSTWNVPRDQVFRRPAGVDVLLQVNPKVGHSE
jgi:hypothetical protein